LKIGKASRNTPASLVLREDRFLSAERVRGGIEVRVRVGQFGYVKWFKDPDDAELIQIEAFCKVEGFYKIIGSKSEEFFYA
jgi:hypothetical protein